MNMGLLADIAFGWRDVLDICLVTLLIYNLIAMAQKTRAMAAIYGLCSIIAVYFVARKLELNTLNWIVENILSSLLILIIIVFQKDIRHALNTLGSHNWKLFSFFSKREDNTALQTIAEAAVAMAQRKIGALIVLERNVPLEDTTERGVVIDASISKELLVSIFWPNSPLHDGATIIRSGRIAAGGCILPLSTSFAKRDLGTRHRAALGITEESDAVVVIVSEERGHVTVAVEGKLTSPLDEAKLLRVLLAAMERR